MSKIKLALDVVEKLHQLAISIEILAKSLQTDEKIETDTSKNEKIVTIEKVRAVLAEKSQSGKQPEVKALIIKYGANKLTDIDPAKYKELLQEAGDL